jgi:hypothetical protein
VEGKKGGREGRREGGREGGREVAPQDVPVDQGLRLFKGNGGDGACGVGADA